MVPLAQGRLGAAAAVPARAQLQRLRPRVGGAVGLGGGPVGLGDHPAHQPGQAEREAFAQRDLSEVDYVYCWADGIHFSIRLGDQGRLCCLVIVGVRANGTKELVAVADGTRESTDDWAELLGDLGRRGMGAPVVMVGDGALGLWRALREVFPTTGEQRCWVHVVRNVLGAPPKSIHAGARRALTEIILAADRGHAEHAVDAFAADYGIKWPKAVAVECARPGQRRLAATTNQDRRDIGHHPIDQPGGQERTGQGRSTFEQDPPPPLAQRLQQ
jgi:hypothetical protein